MKFGKTLQQQIFAQNGFPGWSSFFCDYKGLKKIINSLAKGRPADAALLAAGVRPPRPDAAEQLPVEATTTEAQLFAHASTANGGIVGEGPTTLLQAHKAAFFFKLERELEKINDFYYQRESALKVRLRTLIDKRKLLTASLSEPNGKVKALSRDSSSFGALYEGFRNFERDLGRLQTYIELNATAFRKICKKWDKACRRQADRFGDTRPQEGQPDGQLYLARQVEVQPVFNREFIAQLSDVASANLLSLENLLGGDGQRTGSAALADGSSIDGTTHSAPHLPTLFDRADRAEALEDLETALVSAVKAGEQAIVDEVLGLLLPSTRAPAAEPKGPVARILWRAALEEPTPATATTHATQDGGSEPKAAKPAIPQDLLDFAFVDDINGRTTLHESASAGRLPLVVACLERGLSVAQADVYGRQPLHYAAMNGHAAVCRMLLDAGASPSTADLDGYSPIIYSITNGWTAVVETFLAAGVSFDEPAEAPSGASSADQLNALSLASQYGHEAIARLLLERGAKVLPNPAGYWPQHLAAREGHAGVLSLLVEAIKAQGAPAEGGIDAPDKYSQATPLLHAASEGHVDSVRVLLAAGAAVHAVDEFKRTPVHYAAWQGHIDCVNLLIDAGATIPPQSSQPMDHDVDEAGQATASVSTTDMAPPDLDDLDGDAIPDLSLPPPIIPFRVYGHSYIDEKRLVQVTLGHPNTARAPFPPPIRLYDQPNHGHAPSLKLVITPKPDSSGTSIPHSVILPLADEREVFSFQVDTLADFSLEFDLFPTFGSKMIGKAVAAPSTFADLQSQGSYVVPVIDPHLKVIGDIPFEINVVKPFGRAQLQIGGQFETYWKSTATLQTTAAPGDHGATPATSSVVTASSLSGEHVRIVVQVTADGHPVAYPLWRLPVDGFDISVGDVRLDQFSALAKRLGKSVDPAQVNDREDPSAWYHAIADALVPLEELLSILPASLGVNLELRYPTRSDVRRLSLSRTLEVNDFVDCVLSTVYKSIKSSHPSSSSSSPNGADSTPAHRRIVLSSFNPVVCTALNWKQPNFSVFFASFCGLSRSASGAGVGVAVVDGQPGKLVPANRVEDDRRCTSIREAVKFAKANNLLGIMLEATMLVQIPSLIQSAREHGLLITTFGTASRVVLADAHMTDGVLSYATSDFLAQTAAS
ncbi:cyclin-dependent protein kinase inhibitor [Rhodotorula diobovata]|uniref:Cyclin-dependent protein kinase inhibitor n=1 Tax=Rhodotorula diobovata TaxID=5288 RepID=A0A5C5FUB2_9BASI|nr:cyclin-dependent protein kinase inhibitor [Rhodotorula diobovata]